MAGAALCPNALFDGVEVCPNALAVGVDVCPNALVVGADVCPNALGVDVAPNALLGSAGVPKADLDAENALNPPEGALEAVAPKALGCPKALPVVGPVDCPKAFGCLVLPKALG